MKTIVIFLTLIIFLCNIGYSQLAIPAKDTVDVNTTSIDIFFGINLNTVGSEPNINEILYYALQIQAYRKSKFGFNFGIYSETFSRTSFLSPLSPQITDMLIHQYVIEFSPTYRLYSNKNFKLYSTLITDFAQIGARQQGNNGATITDTRAYALYLGTGLIFDVPYDNIDITIMPAVGYVTMNSGILDPDFQQEGMFFKMRFHAQDLYYNFSVGSSYWRVGDVGMVFLNISYRIDLMETFKGVK